MSERPDATPDAAPDAAQPPWPQYAAAVVELVLDGRHLIVSPCEDPSSTDESSHEYWREPIFVLTAADPYPLQLTPVENDVRLASLCAELDAAGVQHDAALGRSPDWSTWEVSRVLRGIDRARALEIAARHGQLAVYEIGACIRCVDVASGTVVTERAFAVLQDADGSDAIVIPTGR